MMGNLVTGLIQQWSHPLPEITNKLGKVVDTKIGGEKRDSGGGKVNFPPGKITVERERERNGKCFFRFSFYVECMNNEYVHQVNWMLNGTRLPIDGEKYVKTGLLVWVCEVKREHGREIEGYSRVCLHQSHGLGLLRKMHENYLKIDQHKSAGNCQVDRLCVDTA
jgi:hypothetical protein